MRRLLPLAALLLFACRAEVRLERPDERLAGRADTAGALAAVDTVYRPSPIDSTAASFAWLVDRPAPLVPTVRRYAADPEQAARQFLRALAQTGTAGGGRIGEGERGYERAFTYVHPRVRGRRTAAQWAPLLEGIVRPAVVRLEPVEGDTTRVFAEIAVLRELGGESLVGIYWGHIAAAPGDNGWQVTGARLASEDWAARLSGRQPWRLDRAGAAQTYAAEDPAYALGLVRLASGEWVPRARPAPVAHLRLGLPDLR